MRIGETKNIIKAVLNEQNKIALKQTTTYGGQAYQIANYGEIIEALNLLSEQSWNDTSYAEVEKIKNKYGVHETATIETADFNQLNAYINAINAKVTLYYSVLESFVEDQDEKTINIRLPEDITTLAKLSETNKRIENVLKLFNVDGQFEFLGFDKGTEWYILVAKGILSYNFILGCLKIAQEYFKTKTEYFTSEKARISYKASLKENEEFSETGFNGHKDKWLKIFVEEQVKKVISEINQTNGHSSSELQTKLVMATTALIKELDKGTEFHLSLNPPEYAKEQGGELRIDYKQLRELNPVKDNITLQVEAPKEEDESEEEIV
jgi:hypothetical protein